MKLTRLSLAMTSVSSVRVSRSTSWTSAPTALNFSSSATVSSAERWGLIIPRLRGVRLEIGGERPVGRDVYVLDAAIALERIERRLITVWSCCPKREHLSMRVQI